MRDIRLRSDPRSSVLAILVFSGYLALDAARAEDFKVPAPNPADPVDYVSWINTVVGGAVKSSAHPEYIAAYASFTDFPGALDDVLKGPWTGHQAVTDWLNSNTAALDRFRKAAAQNECFFPLERTSNTGNARRDALLLSAAIQHLAKPRGMAKALIAEGYQAWGRNDSGRLRTNAVTILRSAHHLETQPFLIHRLIANASAALAYDALLTGLALSKEPGGFAIACRDDLDAADPAPLPFSWACLGERLTLLDMCQRIYVPGDKPGRWTIHEPTFRAFVEAQAVEAGIKEQLAQSGFEAALQDVSDYFEAVDQWNRVPFHRAGAKAAEMQRVRTAGKSPLARILPELERTRLLDERAAAHRHGLHLIVRILAHRQTKGAFPDSLDALAPHGLVELRVDPFSGKDLVYRKTGDGFMLYSVSDNLKDDGGKHNEKREDGDYVFWPVQPKR
jgi:hypothetical protein